MEFQPFKLIVGFVLVMAVGFGIVALTKETPQEKMQGAFLQTSSALNSLATTKCAEAVLAQIGVHPYTPSETDTDRMAFVTLRWNNVGTAKQIECRYVMNEGIVLLRIDGAAVIEKGRVVTDGGGSRHKPELH